MRQIIWSGLFLASITVLYGQYPDNNWLLGYSTIDSVNNGFGVVHLDFSHNQLVVGEEMEVMIDLNRNISLISTPAGDSILFYFNGLQVNNGAHELAVNGGGMYDWDFALSHEPRQGSLIFPLPDNANEYVLLSTYTIQDSETYNIYCPVLNVSTITTTPRVELVIKNETVVSGEFSNGQLTATRHANGRDWWIIWPYEESNRYLRLLLTPQGIQRMEDQTIGQHIQSGAGAARFSPDGSLYAMYNNISAQVGGYFDLFDFDRCTGLLSNQRQNHLEDSGAGTGLAFSQDSRFLYISASNFIYQLDLWTADPFTTLDTVAIDDGVRDPFPSRFNEAQLARDGKIYLSSTSGIRKLHVMDYPNRQGVACNVRQRGIELPVYMGFGVPNFPFHRLGPLDGSPCDTLGIDNIPLADFRSDQDSSDYRSFFFQNLSTYEPATWSWSFGDGSMSQDTSPVHTYAQDGVYEVCLTVSNEYGADTSCDTLYLGVVNSTEVTAPQVTWQLFPNPARDYFTFNLLGYYPREAYLELYNSMGQRVRRQRVFAGWNTVEIDGLPSGVYSYQLWDSGSATSAERDVRLGSGKVVKME